MHDICWFNGSVYRRCMTLISFPSTTYFTLRYPLLWLVFLTKTLMLLLHCAMPNCILRASRVSFSVASFSPWTPSEVSLVPWFWLVFQWVLSFVFFAQCVPPLNTVHAPLSQRTHSSLMFFHFGDGLIRHFFFQV